MAGYLEGTLNLPVNREKSEVGMLKDITFLGIRISGRRTKISEESILKFKRKVKLLTRRNNPVSMHRIIIELNKYVRGWINYYRVQQMAGILADLDVWIRHRLRVMQLKKWKKPTKFQRVMSKAGFDPREAHRTWVNMKTWALDTGRNRVLRVSQEWFRNSGLVFLNDFRPASSQIKDAPFSRFRIPSTLCSSRGIQRCSIQIPVLHISRHYCSSVSTETLAARTPCVFLEMVRT